MTNDNARNARNARTTARTLPAATITLTFATTGRYLPTIGETPDEGVYSFRTGRGAIVIEWSDGLAELVAGNAVEDVVTDLGDLLEAGGYTGSFRVRPATRGDVDAVADILADEASEASEAGNGYDDSEPSMVALRRAAAAFGEWL